jgi:hypothetical protein
MSRRRSVDPRTRDEASGWVAEELERLRAPAFDELLGMDGEAVHREMRSASGAVLVRETQVFRDDGLSGPLRAVVDVYDPSARGLVVRSLASGGFVRAREG